MLAIGRSLMSAPQLILLDEPSLGLSPLASSEVFAAIQELHRSGLSLLLVEQNVAASLRISARAYVLEQGRIVAQGLPDDLLKQPHIREAYLGV